ncbi:MAG TPA: D-aminoacyl-tRNA deacylase [Opitutus sp.]|nr:D-aminoacyl-tRNA deacylase [Opitutus sp.]
MRAVLQRVSSAAVSVAGEIVGAIDAGLLILLGVQTGDTEADTAWLAQKTAALRIFEDAAGKMNLSLLDVAAGVSACRSSESNPRPAGTPAATPPLALVVSQFTLIASTRKGTRPSFNDAAKPNLAIPLYESFIRQLESALGRPVATGRFGAMMKVSLVNDGPVTIVLDSRLRE